VKLSCRAASDSTIRVHNKDVTVLIALHRRLLALRGQLQRHDTH
jgi:hypothetical protein